LTDLSLQEKKKKKNWCGAHFGFAILSEMGDRNRDTYRRDDYYGGRSDGRGDERGPPPTSSRDHFYSGPPPSYQQDYHGPPQDYHRGGGDYNRDAYRGGDYNRDMYRGGDYSRDAYRDAPRDTPRDAPRPYDGGFGGPSSRYSSGGPTLRGISRVYIGDIPKDLRRQEVEDEFRRVGQVLSVQIHSNVSGGAYGFVEFGDPRDASECVRRYNGRACFSSRPIRVELSRGAQKERSTNKDSGPGAGASGTLKRTEFRVLVLGLPPNFQWQDLKDFGRTVSVAVSPSRAPA